MQPDRELAVRTERLGVVYPAPFRLGRRRTDASHGAVRALDAVDLDVGRGEIVGVLGPNGSGKTSLLEVLAGIRRPSTGTATVLGIAPTERALVQRVGYQPEGPLPFPHFSGTELLTYLGSLAGFETRTLRQRVAPLLDHLGLGAAARRPVRTYSTGMARRLAIAAALLPEPELILLDEPTSGLDPLGSLLVLELLRERANAGCAIVLASHHLQEVEEVCDRVFLLHGGRVERAGALDELLGTSERQLTVTGLDADGERAVVDAVVAAGGAPSSWRTARRHLFDLFRSLGRSPNHDTTRAGGDGDGGPPNR